MHISYGVRWVPFCGNQKRAHDTRRLGKPEPKAAARDVDGGEEEEQASVGEVVDQGRRDFGDAEADRQSESARAHRVLGLGARTHLKIH